MNNSDTFEPMLSRRIRPVPALQDIVESIWIQHQHKPPVKRLASRVIPTGTVEILFHYGDLITHIEPDGVAVMPRSYVTGQRSQPVTVLGTGRQQAILVSLYPWGLEALFPGVSELTDGYVDLNLLGNTALIEPLEWRLARANGHAQRLRLVQDFLLTIRSHTINPAMVAASKLLASPASSHPVRCVTRVLGISERHLSRQFKASIGLQPSMFMRIMRFQNAMRARRTTGLRWAAIAADCGYSDQPHLVREVRRFSGHTPGGISLESGAGKSAFNGEDASEFFDTVYL